MPKYVKSREVWARNATAARRKAKRRFPYWSVKKVKLARKKKGPHGMKKFRVTIKMRYEK